MPKYTIATSPRGKRTMYPIKPGEYEYDDWETAKREFVKHAQKLAGTDFYLIKAGGPRRLCYGHAYFPRKVKR